MMLPAWLAAPPETTEHVYAWFLTLFIAYMLLRKAVVRIRGGRPRTTMARLSDGGTFAGSLLLLIGVIHPATLKALGDTTAFLTMAGVGGLFYACEQLAEDTG